MRRFNKVSPNLWQSARFKGLSIEGRYLMLYYLTSTHNNSAGAYAIPAGYASVDLGLSIEHYKKVRQELLDADLIQFDEHAETVLIERWFKHNFPDNPKHMIGTRKVIDTLPSDALCNACHMALDEAETHSTLDPNARRERTVTRLETGHMARAGKQAS